MLRFRLESTFPAVHAAAAAWKSAAAAVFKRCIRLGRHLCLFPLSLHVFLPCSLITRAAAGSTSHLLGQGRKKKEAIPDCRQFRSIRKHGAGAACSPLVFFYRQLLSTSFLLASSLRIHPSPFRLSILLSRRLLRGETIVAFVPCIASVCGCRPELPSELLALPGLSAPHCSTNGSDPIVALLLRPSETVGGGEEPKTGCAVALCHRLLSGFLTSLVVSPI